jgi:ribonuclease D
MSDPEDYLMNEELRDQVDAAYVSNSEDLERALGNIGRASSIALDCEADSLHHYYEKVCLLQINTGTHIYIIDPLQIRDLSPLFDSLDRTLLVIHGADYDLRLLRKDFDFTPARIFDTVIAVRLLGYKNLGLADQVMTHFGVHLSKSAQKTDWSRRPLSEKMLHYARNDVHYLLDLWKILKRELEERGRVQWMEESCENLIAAASVTTLREPEREWRINGATALGGQGMALVRALWYWRDEKAQEVNFPSFKIVTNELIIALAAWALENREAPLGECPGLPRYCRQRWYDELQRVISKALDIRPEKWPRPLRGKRGDTRHVDKTVLAMLKSERDGIAGNLGVDPPVLATQKSLSLIAAGFPETIDALGKAGGLMNWQREVLGESFLNVVREFKGKKRAR